ncbi:MAG TPA: DUF3306 domain-containing protein [Burkholderiales bacterium]|nr:DUF3306 domain-containing protein [Burkholderiales bacterium]
MSTDDDNFLARWSKRKHAVRRGETPPEPVRSEAQPADPTPPAPPVPDAPPELPAVDSLKGLESDYKDFLRPEVDPATRSAALKKLFGDPHFNQMDGLDTYIDDYTKEDPIPATMLSALNQARSLGLFDDEGKEKVPEAPPAAETSPVAAVGEAPPAAIQPSALGMDAKMPPPARAKPDSAGR